MEVVLYPDPVLRAPAQPIETFDEALADLVQEMKETMVRYGGVGLAAPQVGISKRLLVLSETGELANARALINPTVKLSGEKVTQEEGCLSFPRIHAEILRPDRIEIEAVDERGNPQTFEAEGWLSRIIQHEFDHLEGRLFIDRMSPADRVRIKKALKALREEFDGTAA